MELMTFFHHHLLNFLADGGNGADKVNGYLRDQISSWAGSIFTLISTIGGLGLVSYIAGFWIGYAFADEDTKDEKKIKWKKNGLVLILTGCGFASFGLIGGPLLAVFGIPTT